MATADFCAIGYQSWLRDLLPADVTASGDSPEAPKDALLRADTAEFWQPPLMPAYWIADLGAARAVDYIGIAGHTIGSSGAAVNAEYSALPTPVFSAPLTDAGAGVVSLVLQRGTGSATFTRATIAWAKLSTGLWKEVASGVPRFHYHGANTISNADGGYLAEGARTNRCLWNRDLTNAAWVKTTATAAKTQAGIDGVTNSASSLTATAGNATALQTIVSASAGRIYSAFVKRLTGTGAIEMTMDNGGTWTAITSLINSATYSQVNVPTATTTNPIVGFRIVTNGDAIAVDMAQEETGSFASTPIPTTTVAVTRNSDDLVYPYAGNGNAAVGTAYAEIKINKNFAIVGTSTALTFGGATDAMLGINDGDGADSTAIRDATNVVVKGSLSLVTTGSRKRASSWGGSVMAVTGDGAAPATGAFDGALGSAVVSIGAPNGASSNNWFGTIKNVHIWTTQLTDAQLQSITAASLTPFDPPWMPLAAPFAPANDAPIMLLMATQVTTNFVRITLTGPIAPRLAVLYAGLVLSMPRDMTAGGFTPPNLSRQTVLHQSLSRGGQFLGQGYRRMGVTGSIAFKYLDPDWVRSTFDPFVKEARRSPYFIAWWKARYPAEVSFMWTDKDIVPEYSGFVDAAYQALMDVKWNMVGIGDE